MMETKLLKLIVCGILIPAVLSRNVNIEWDPKGYLLYCPCSGRFSNQVNTFLSTLLFTKQIGRTLVIPPFIQYSHMQATAGQSEYIPFDSYFDIEALHEYYPDVITMGDFLDHLAPTYWPPSERAAYCARKLADINDGKCPRTGNPHGTFWEELNIEFAKSEIWEEQMHYNVDYEPWKNLWIETYPADEHPVLALMNAPSFQPIQPNAEELHRYLKWLPDIVDEGEEFIKENIERPYIGIHLRNGADWTRTCELADGNHPRLMSSHQCMGHYSQEGVTKEVCIQSEEQVIKELEDIITKHEAKTIFIATDHVSMEDEIQDAYPDVRVVTMSPERPQVDLYILEESDHFLGNCVSAFSAYVSRSRVNAKRSVSHLGYNPAPVRDEL
ncbi:GDP-fucose protein O-fucosyltransferase 1-like isoform X2 [Apostichopus japonicus]|uniref:GDP-fucose protein O-fucosyltransferase 1-like isoform X2 n=1 Tax=Stichopus japonicus TaxID=307972 RepID=UPI003AB5B66A